MVLKSSLIQTSAYRKAVLCQSRQDLVGTIALEVSFLVVQIRLGLSETLIIGNVYSTAKLPPEKIDRYIGDVLVQRKKTDFQKVWMKVESAMNIRLSILVA